MPYKYRIRIGYACLNTKLREQNIFCSRTCRLATVREKGMNYAKELARLNLIDLLTILKWNEEHGIRFFRISSDIFPHITNPRLIPIGKRGNPKNLAYSLDEFIPMLSRIGRYARKYKHRLTFHPDQFVILGGSDSIRLNSVRTLWQHAIICDIIGLDLNSILIIHGGGTYGEIEVASQKWIDAFDALPIEIKRRLVVENDERSYAVSDVMALSSRVRPYMSWHTDDTRFKIPIVLDIFHYKCYETRYPGVQPRLEAVLPDILDSWHGRMIKMHISEQRPDSHVGAHSLYIKTIPKILLDFPKTYGTNLDLMVEAKAKELALVVLLKKYPICI